MKLLLVILAFVAVVTGFATMPANATTPERMTYSGGGRNTVSGGAFLLGADFWENGNDFVLSEGGRRQ